jgi:hypothetical protein
MKRFILSQDTSGGMNCRLNAKDTDIDKRIIEKLIFMIYMDMQEEVTILSNIVTSLNNINEVFIFVYNDH